jgi:predicted transcriptional regulator YdeE
MSSVTPERFEDDKPMLIAGLRRHHSFEAAEPGIAEQWREFLSRERIPGGIDSTFYGVMCGSDALGFEYMCGVEVQSFAPLAAGIGRMRIPAQRYAVFTHPRLSTLGSTWHQILAWLSDSEYDSAHRPDFERYPSAPNPMSVSEGVEVWVGVVERGAKGEAR